MYKIVYTNRMKKDARLMKRRGKDLDKLVNVLSLLASGNPLPIQYRDHQLSGKLRNFIQKFLIRLIPIQFHG